MRKFFTAAVAATVGLSAVPAVAQTEIIQIRVPVADLDLTQKSDVELLKQRVAERARAACQVRSPLGHSLTKTDWSCVESALSHASERLATKSQASSTLRAN